MNPVDFSGKINEDFDINSWKEKTNQIAEKNEYPIKVINKSLYHFFVIVMIIFIISVLILSVILLIGVFKGKFQSLINTTINPLFNASINNEYTFTPSTSNYFYNNLTIPININMQGMNCTCVG